MYATPGDLVIANSVFIRNEFRITISIADELGDGNEINSVAPVLFVRISEYRGTLKERDVAVQRLHV
jgi:hypothetical protein